MSAGGLAGKVFVHSRGAGSARAHSGARAELPTPIFDFFDNNTNGYERRITNKFMTTISLSITNLLNTDLIYTGVSLRPRVRTSRVRIACRFPPRSTTAGRASLPCRTSSPSDSARLAPAGPGLRLSRTDFFCAYLRRTCPAPAAQMPLNGTSTRRKIVVLRSLIVAPSIVAPDPGLAVCRAIAASLLPAQ